MQDHRRALEHKATALTVVVALQALAAVFFVVDAAGDIRSDGINGHLFIEAAAAAALLVGVGLGAWQVRALVLRARQDEAAVAIARGAMAELVRLRFHDWGLTAAEADVALFALKGCDVAEIASLRSAAPGTVRAQLARVYTKSGTSSRAGLLAQFIDDLIEPS